MKTNVQEWKALHRAGYFDTHPHYQGAERTGGDDLERIAEFIELKPEMTAAIVGSGYGRETALIAPKVRKVYCIDVDKEILLRKMIAFLKNREIHNIAPVLFEQGWEQSIPEPLDFVYSRNVFQHTTRDITADYFFKLARKLRAGGRMFFQFAECLGGGTTDVVPGQIYEPQVNWTVAEIRALADRAGLFTWTVKEEKLREAGFDFWWHWALLGPGGEKQ